MSATIMTIFSSGQRRKAKSPPICNAGICCISPAF